MPDGLFKYVKGGHPAWGVRLKFKNDDDQWRAKTWRGFATQRDARAFRDQARDARERQAHPAAPTESPTLRDYLQTWVATYAGPNCKRSTWLSYVHVINKYWLPAMGTLPLTHITTQHVKDLLKTLLDAGKSRQTIRNIIGPAREAFNHAVSEQLMPTNPVLVLKPHLRQLRDPKRHIHPLTAAQRAALLRAAKALDPTLHLGILLAVYTGMRTGELLGLQWRDLDLTHKQLTMRRARVWNHLDTPKNHHIRVIDLAPVLIKALRHPAKAHPEDHVLQHQGAPITAKWFAKQFKTAQTRAKLPGVTPKTLRHTYASSMIAIGANPKYIQAQMGHSSIKVTFDIYGHLFQTERFVDKLG